MTNQIKDICIGIVILVMCLLITVFTKITFWWVFLPIVFILLLLILSKLLQERFGKTYGIVYYIGALLLIPAIWYLVCSNMPMASVVAETKKKSEDLATFKDYPEGVDAKEQVAQYQMKQDSILKEQVALLLQDGKVDSALALIRDNATSSQKIKNELFSSISPSQNKQPPQPTEQKSDFKHYDNVVCGEYPETSTRYLTQSDLAGKSKVTLRIMRNEIFMRHGYIFKTKDLSDYFSRYSCYNPLYADVSKMLTEVEKSNVEYIKKAE